MYHTTYNILNNFFTVTSHKLTRTAKRKAHFSETIAKLQKKLRQLQQANKSASLLINERRRLLALLHQEESEKLQKSGKTINDNIKTEKQYMTKKNKFAKNTQFREQENESESIHKTLSSPSLSSLEYLPQNNALNSAMAFMLHQQRDKRAELEFTRRLVTSTLLSFASPVGPWDPYDVKPQVFALDTFIALPVFTSLEFAKLFCAQFGFTVRDPSGILWVDGQREREQWYNTNKNTHIYGLLEPSYVTCEESWEKIKSEINQNNDVSNAEVANEHDHLEHNNNSNNNNINNSTCEKNDVNNKINTDTVPESSISFVQSDCAENTAHVNKESSEITECREGMAYMTAEMLFDLIDPETTLFKTLSSSSSASSAESSSTQAREHKCVVKEASFHTVKKDAKGSKYSKKKFKMESKERRREQLKEESEECEQNNANAKIHRRDNCSISKERKLCKLKKKGKVAKRKHKVKSTSNSDLRRSNRMYTRTEEDTSTNSSSESESVHKLLDRLGTIQPFNIKQAVPLPMFGPLIRPYFVGYFADIDTLLQNASIVPAKVDFIVNPCSPLEFVLAREAADRIKNKDELLALAYRNLEKELQREFAAFFTAYCPEVKEAKSACIPLPLTYSQIVEMNKQIEHSENICNNINDDSYSNNYNIINNINSSSINRQRNSDSNRSGAEECSSNLHNESGPFTESHVSINSQVGSRIKRGNSAWERRNAIFRLQRELEFSNWMNYELVIIVDSSDYACTFSKLQTAKHNGVIVGHSELDVLPVELAASHVQHAASLFYDRNNTSSWAYSCDKNDNNRVRGNDSKAKSHGSFCQIGDTVTISTNVSAESFYQDPTNVYTESHAVFTEDLRVNRGQREIR